MDDLAICVIDWDEEGIQKQKEKFEAWGYPNVYTFCDRNHHETQNLNAAMRIARDRGFKYWHLASADVEYRYRETIPTLYEYIVAHDDVGIVHPFTQGEEAQPNAVPYDFYLQDGTGLTVKLDLNGWFPQWDEEFLATGWADLDLGEQVRHHGFKIMNDRRYPVKHYLGGTKSRNQKSFLMSMERRNRLILQAKWHIIGIDGWAGVEEYNKTVPVTKRIPTMFELMTYTDDQLKAFWISVCPEHPRIWLMDGNLDPNDYWENPIICGYDTRQKFQEKYGYGG